MMSCSRASLAAAAAAALVTSAWAGDWPQWRGPQRNGISAETDWQPKWGAGGPRKLWTAQLGAGYSAVAVSGGRVYSVGNAGNRDTVFCLDANNGRVVWRQSYPCRFGDMGGPRATPVLDGGRVYTMSEEAQAYCLNAGTGKVIWNRDLARETGAQRPQWGFAGSALIQGNLAIYNVGATGTALDKTSGQVVWKSGGRTGYASPVAYKVGAQQAVALFAGTGLVAVNPVNGRQLWSFPWQTSYDVNAADPIFSFDKVFISSNYGKGCALLRVTGGRPEVVWQNREMKNHFNTCVLLAGSIYGNDENTLKCLDLSTGAERWRHRGGIGKGGLIASNGHLLVLTESGELLVIKATPTAYTEVSRAKVMGGTCWTHPVLANGRLYCRNSQGELVCLALK